jgi:hypothetical protein
MRITIRLTRVVTAVTYAKDVVAAGQWRPRRLRISEVIPCTNTRRIKQLYLPRMCWWKRARAFKIEASIPTALLGRIDSVDPSPSLSCMQPWAGWLQGKRPDRDRRTLRLGSRSNRGCQAKSRTRYSSRTTSNQQSAEEAGHGDKVFGNAYYALGGASAGAELNVLGDPHVEGLQLVPSDDLKQNREQLEALAAIIGGIETVALQHTFPALVRLCERWDHPVVRDLLKQIRDVVRPEESRHVLLFRYMFHQLVADQGEVVIGEFMNMTNGGRAQMGAEALDREAFERLVGTKSPTRHQLLGKSRALTSYIGA